MSQESEEEEQATAKADPYGMTTRKATANADPCGMTTRRATATVKANAFDAGVSAALGGDRVQELDQCLGGLFAVFAGDLVVGYEADGVGAYGAA